MNIIKEPKEIDFSIKSEPWSEEELIEFRKIMNIEKQKNVKLKSVKKKTNKELSK
ncbi:hypothetical protein SAMN05444143_112107 [Flavobacterium succinicans]|jgi:hypothetical protein|uniref:Uncharacterized protein n=1 Tax=Flavobacterium succinicans TaxID=29536 RepID=A0A1I4YU22_9FLAO|nr:hypothetical protein [Flavobacterium succinicans]SFN41120.1 hypothetical protein SAMN05444143_112107 [Flavobacterium succinicans]